MPELPEVETTRRGVSPFLVGQQIEALIVRQPRLRYLVSSEMNAICTGQRITQLSRRAKYLILHLSKGYLLIHLGMSGHLRILPAETVAGKHDHIDLQLSTANSLRYCDPRRFGLWLYAEGKPEEHPLLARLGPEPLDEEFNGNYLKQKAGKRQIAIKSFIMQNGITVGVGNIYATESLYAAAIHPQTPVGTLSFEDCYRLVTAIKKILGEAILAGGTTLKDFYNVQGKPGYFAQALQVYGRKNLPCFKCQTLIKAVWVGGRQSAYCPTCQPAHKA